MIADIGWQPLQARCQTSQVTMMYRIINNPIYILSDPIPPPFFIIYKRQQYHSAELTTSDTLSSCQQQDCGTKCLTTL
ncbi:hypothetical protein DPMN_088829 [Dreissena polymorpha]|uniref:Uncharacterized protein n=1 Tax=Dreissena polymorpha TaxID=45954 RepID=A0A9D4QXM5_DREPO|nr:hypothetical protein DPMN_088829 [Dreissena polymorpha]